MEMDSGIPGPTLESRRDEGMPTATAPMEIPTVPPPAPPPEEYVPEIRVHSNSGGGDVAAKAEMVIYDPSCADPAKTKVIGKVVSYTNILGAPIPDLLNEVDKLIETDTPPNKSILLTGWARRLKGGEVRSRCVLKDFATTVRDDVFAPTPSPLSVRGLLLYAAWFDLRVVTGDLVCAFMQADSSCKMFARPPKGQERDGWIWRLHGAMNDMRTASRDFTEFLAGMLTENMGFKRGKPERCLFVHESNETRVVSHVDDPLICAKRATLEQLWTQITNLVVDKR